MKVDNCTFDGNSGYIGDFRGLNRYQVLNSAFTNNTGSTIVYYLVIIIWVRVGAVQYFRELIIIFLTEIHFQETPEL